MMFKTVSLAVLLVAATCAAQAQSDLEKLKETSGDGPGTRKDAIAEQYMATAESNKALLGTGVPITTIYAAIKTTFPNVDPKAYADCMVSSATKQELVLISQAYNAGDYETVARLTAAIFQKPETQACLKDAGLPLP